MWIIQSKYDSPDFFYQLEKELLCLIEEEKNLVANLSNISSWIYHTFPGLNWCGFYLWDNEDQELVLGPFQGRPACIRIKPNRGVCGAAFRLAATQRVDDVHAFPGHIACDSNTLSELVIPLKKGSQILGVLDLDSPEKSRFSSQDAEELTRIVSLLTEKIF